MALLAYTNYTDHSAAFSSTFRRTTLFESDQSFKIDIKNTIIGQLLREL